MTLRTRIAAAFALVAGVVAATIGVVVHELAARDGMDRARARALGEADAAARFYARVGVRPVGAEGVGATAAPPALVAAVADGRAATLLADDPAAPTIWAGRPVPDRAGGVFVGISYVPERDALVELRRTLAAAGIAATLAGALLGVLIAGRLSRRLRRAAEIAERVAGGDLGARVGVDGRDEVAALGRAMDAMAGSLADRLEREQRFVADVAHDLRTPLTGLVTAVELLPDGRDAETVRRGVARLRALVEDLLEVARLDAGAEEPDARPVDLGRLVRGVAVRHPGTVVLDHPPLIARVDPRRLERILENVLANAGKHGAPPVEIELGTRPGAHRIAIRDHGPGFPPELLADATRRFATGDASRSRGTGLGLAIAEGQAGVLGGTLVVGNAPGGGALIVVALPAEAA